MSAGSCGPNQPNDVPSGTGVTQNNLTYITQDDTTFVPVISHNKCFFEGQDADNSSNGSNIPIQAQNPGANYNTSTATFTVVGRSDVSASGSARVAALTTLSR